MTCFWSIAFCIADDPQQPDIATGYVRATGLDEALRKIGDRRANVFALPVEFCWPPEAEGLDVYCISKLAHRELNSLSVPES